MLPPRPFQAFLAAAARPWRVPLRAWPASALLLPVLLGLGLLSATGARGAAFQVSPTRFEFSLERRFTDFFTVTNNSGAPLRLRVTTAFLAADESGTLREQEGHAYDLAPWLVLNPRRITLGPAEKRVVRFTVRPPAGLSPGEYRTVVFFEELPPRPEDPDRDAAGFRIQILTRLGVTIYGRVGQPRAELRVESTTVAVEDDAVRVTGLLHNAGTAHTALELTATLLDEGDAGPDDAALGGTGHGTAEQRLTVQREQRRAFEFRLPRPPAGRYRLRLVARVGERPVLQEERPVTVEPSTR